MTTRPQKAGDGLLQHAETAPIEGKSYRAKERGEPQD
jgi:hypothetical protein